MKRNSSALLCFSITVLCSFASLSFGQSTGELRFQVIDAETRFGIEGARLNLDTVPPNGAPEYSDVTGPFGFAALTALPASSYVLTVSHAGYAAYNTNLVVAASTTVNGVISLAPVSTDRFDLSAEVRDVTTGIALSGVAVVAERFNGAGDISPAESRQAVTDAAGYVDFRGMASGFYRFRANNLADGGPTRPGWQPFTTQGFADDKKFLGTAHTADIKLKPVAQSLLIRVTGFDPVTGDPFAPVNVPLKGVFVEVTGLDPEDLQSEVLPTQSSVADDRGEALFTGLPAVPVLVAVKRMGYFPQTWLIQPDATERLPASAQTINLPLQPTRLDVTLTSPYVNHFMHGNIEVRLEGMADSVTEDIDRSVLLSNVQNHSLRIFSNLMPGRYHLSVNARQPGTDAGTEYMRPQFLFADLVETIEGQTVAVDAELEVVPAMIRGRLFAAEERALLTNERGNRDASVYGPREQTGIELVEYETNPVLGEVYKITSVDTDENGEFAIAVTPGLYGLRIPGMTDYWGSHVMFFDVASSEDQFSQGWPFASWPFSGQPPRNGGLLQGNPLRVASGREYRLDMFVRKQAADIGGEVWEIDSPTFSRILSQVPGFPSSEAKYSDLASGGGMAILEPADGGASVTVPLVANDLNNTGNTAYRFRNVPPGTYTVRFTHPRFTFQERFAEPTIATVTIPPWEAPGVAPTVNPRDQEYVEPLHVKMVPTFEGTYIPSGSNISYQTHIWNEIPNGVSQYVDGILFPEAHGPFKAAYTGDALFSSSDIYPQGAFTTWFYITQAGGYAEVEIGASGERKHVDVFIGGPSATALVELPAPGYDLTLDAVSQHDPMSRVPGVQITLQTPNGNQTFEANGQTLIGFTGSLSVPSATHPFWIRSGELKELVDPVKPSVKYTAFMTRGVQVRGSAKHMGNNSALPGVRVVVYDRFGRPVPAYDAMTDSLGQFAFEVPLPDAPHFVEMAMPGFLPWRKRFAPADFVEDSEMPQSAFIQADALLEPIPPPDIQSVTMNRNGFFLPGVTRGGDDQIFSPDRAEQALTLTWQANVFPSTITYEQQAFDSADGTAGAMETVTMEDRVAEAWLIDPRVYLGNPLYGEDLPLELPPPSTQHRQLLRWLAEVRTGTSSNAVDGGTISNVLHQVVRHVSPPPPGMFLATGELNVGKLPPEQFRPVFYAVSQHGAVGMRNDFASAETPPQLEGLNLPPWMAFTSDIIGMAASLAATTGLDPTTNQLERWMPKGRLTALPKFTVGIKEKQEKIDYAYALDVKWKEAMDTPRSGLLSLAPGVLGLEFIGHLGFGLSATNSRLYLSGGADVKGKTNSGPFFPKGLTNYGTAEVNYNIAASTVASAFLDPDDPREFELAQSIGGGVETKTDLNLKPLTSKLPYVGPVLTSLDKTKALELFGTVVGSIGMVSTARVTTVYPPPRPETSVPGQLDQVFRRDFIGGNEEIAMPVLQGQRSLDLCVRFGGGLTAKVGGGKRAGASGLFLVQGQNCNAGFPALTITPNSFGDWPLITRVQGSLDFELEAFLDVWVSRFKKKWTWSLLPIDHQFGTEPTFVFQPVDISTEILSPGAAEAVTFTPGRETLIEDFFEAGSLSFARGGSGHGLVFTDIDPITGLMSLKFSSRLPGGLFATPVEIARAGGIAAVSIGQWPGGDWLAVWTQIDAVEVGNPFPSSTLMFAQGTANGANWSAPQIVARLPDVAFDLRLALTDTLAGLAFLHTDQGPASDQASLSLTTFNGSTWTAPATIVANVPVRSFDVAASSATEPDALIGLLDATGLLHTWSWTPAGVSEPQTIATDAGSVFALAADSEGNYAAAWDHPGESIVLSRLDTGTWSRLGILPGTLPAEIDLTSVLVGGSDSWLVTWTAGGNPLNVQYAFLNGAGESLEGPRALTSDEVGAYSELQLVTDGEGSAKLLARFDADGASARQFQILFGTGDSQPQLVSPRLTDDGRIEFFVLGDAGQVLRIQVSRDLRTWTDFATDVVPSDTEPFRATIFPNEQRLYFRGVGQ